MSRPIFKIVLCTEPRRGAFGFCALRTEATAAPIEGAEANTEGNENG